MRAGWALALALAAGLVPAACAVADTEYYDILSVHYSASERDIRKAFKRLALQLHPDRAPGGDEKLFLEINEAYTVLKDATTRRQYDSLGRRAFEAKRKGGHEARRYGGGFHQQNFHDFFHRQHRAGLYDDDDQVEKLTDASFWQLDASDQVGVVNFFSPGCGHCHDLAPAWRDLGTALEGVVTVGAVNCHEVWGLCQRLGIRAYPTVLRLGAGGEHVRFGGPRELDALVNFALESFGKPREVTRADELASLDGPKLLVVCGMAGTPLAATELPMRRLAAALHGTMPVWELDCAARPHLCADSWEDNHARFVANATDNWAGERFFPPAGEEWDTAFSADALAEAAVGRLPLPDTLSMPELAAATLPEQHDALSPHVVGDRGLANWHVISTSSACESNDDGVRRTGSYEFADSLEHCQAFCTGRQGCVAVDFFASTRWCNFFDVACTTPKTSWDGASSHRLQRGTGVVAWLVFFARDDSGCPKCAAALSTMRRAAAQLSRLGVVSRLVRCDTEDGDASCPAGSPPDRVSATLYKTIGREDYPDAIDEASTGLVAWARAAMTSTLVSLQPAELSAAINHSPQSWFVDFISPGCPPCRALAPKFREAADLAGAQGLDVRFGTFDCERHPDACAERGVEMFPSPVFFNDSDPRQHPLDGDFFSMGAGVILEHVHDVRSPPLFAMTPDTWATDVIGSPALVLVVFSAGRWCGPCAVSVRELSAVAKNLRGLDFVRLGIVDCDAHAGFCQGHHALQYPDLRLFSAGPKSLADGGQRFVGQIWAQHVTAWIASGLPNKAHQLSEATFESSVMGDGHPWFVVFSCPRWCAPCRRYRDDLRLIAAVLDARGAQARAAHIDCDDYRALCNSQGVRAYPTLRLFRPGQQTLETRNGQMDALRTAEWIMEKAPGSAQGDAAQHDEL